MSFQCSHTTFVKRGTHSCSLVCLWVTIHLTCAFSIKYFGSSFSFQPWLEYEYLLVLAIEYPSSRCGARGNGFQLQPTNSITSFEMLRTIVFNFSFRVCFDQTIIYRFSKNDRRLSMFAWLVFMKNDLIRWERNFSLPPTSKCSVALTVDFLGSRFQSSYQSTL